MRRRRPRLSTLAALALASGVCVVSPRFARADPIPTNDYAIDLFQGPILAPIRIMGIGGAFAGVGEGIAAFVSNAAAPAVRAPYSYDYVTGDLTGSISIPFSLTKDTAKDDFDDSGSRDHDYSDFIYVTGGAEAQVGPVGVGAIGEVQSYSITASDGGKTTVIIGKYHALAATSVFGGQAAIGVGARAVTMSLDRKTAGLSIAGVAPELGFLVRPDWLPFRFGATLRFAVDGGAIGNVGTIGQDGLRREGGLVLPREVDLPWELEVGAALQIGPRPLNPAWIDPRVEEEPIEHRIELARRERAARKRATDGALPKASAEAYDAVQARREKAIEEDEDAYLEGEEKYMRDQRTGREQAWPREKILITASLLTSGPIDDGVSVERFLAQGIKGEDESHVVGSSGANVSFSPRFGIEAEPVVDQIATRAGTYYEPNRFGGVGRQHFTFGADVKLFSTTFFGIVPKTTYALSAAMDLAPRYQSLSASLSVWH